MPAGRVTGGHESLYTTLYYSIESSILYGVQVVAGSNPVAPTLSFVKVDGGFGRLGGWTLHSR